MFCSTAGILVSTFSPIAGVDGMASKTGCSSSLGATGLKSSAVVYGISLLTVVSSTAG